jgi:hypothetical protein
MMTARAYRRAVRTRMVAALAVAVVATGCATEVDLPVFARGPVIGDHYHVAYGVFVCDDFVDVAEHFDAAHGIHTHEDHVIHIHPSSAQGTGANATLGLFLGSAARVSITDGQLTVDGVTYRDGDSCGGAPGRAVVARWSDAADATSGPEVVDARAAGQIGLAEHAEAFTIAFVPDGATIPAPPAASWVDDLGATYSS